MTRTPATFRDLARRLQEAEGPSTSLDVELYKAFRLLNEYAAFPAYTGSIDAAATLMPLEWEVTVIGPCGGAKRWFCRATLIDGNDEWEFAPALTEPLARCAAACLVEAWRLEHAPNA